MQTTRALAADAVQKVGNGHPGTAISLAPLMYTLFHKVLRNDPADDQWLGRDRFVLSCGHSSLTQYIQLFLSGYGLELKDLKALRGHIEKLPPGPMIAIGDFNATWDHKHYRDLLAGGIEDVEKNAASLAKG